MQQSLKTLVQLVLGTIILWMGSIYVIRGDMSIGQLITYNALLAYFTTPIQSIINLQTKLQAARIAHLRLQEIYSVESEFKLKKPINKDKSINGDVLLRGVSYQYGFGSCVVNDIDLKIKENSKIVIVGKSGSGKTTLAQLLVGFMDPTYGDIDFNGQMITDIDKHQLRDHVNYVPQDPYVFEGTIRDNLTLKGNIDVRQEDLDWACNLVEMKEDIRKMPLGFETVIAEDGMSLSGGQKQRLAMARSLLANAKILIFDESTSNLDVITEKKITNRLMELEDKTIIFIAHHLNIARNADEIIVMERGHIVERGNSEELMQRKKYYFELVTGQI